MLQDAEPRAERRPACAPELQSSLRLLSGQGDDTLVQRLEALAVGARRAMDQLAYQRAPAARPPTPEYDPKLGAGDEHGWPMRDDPSLIRDKLPLYDVRPDDAVPVESERGADFLEAFNLLSEEPDFEGAVQALNELNPLADVLAEGADASPDVSIIIPVYGQLAYTLNCLHALLTHATRYSFEIIVGDDQSPDESGEHLPNLRWIRTLRHEENLGFIDNCNAAARSARGEWIVLLNNDTRVVEGWLDELIGAFGLFPNAGLVGSKLFYPDGSLQEAGGIIWRDGSAWNYGRERDPNEHHFCYARRVDYVSGAAIALRLDLWRLLGGFDDYFRPAYAEDADLALRVRAEGLEIWYQPTSRLIHYEGRTSGTDVSQGVKAYQVINLGKLFHRWRGALTQHGPNGFKPWLEKDRGVEKRALVIEATMLTPDQDAGSVYCLNILKALQELGYKIVFAPVDNFLFQKRYTRDLQRLGVECLYAPFTVSLEQHLRRAGDQYDLVHVFRPSVLKAVAGFVDHYCPNAKLVYNNHDLHYLRLSRQAVVENSPELAAKVLEKKQEEFEIMKRAEVVCTPSSAEKEILDSAGFPRPTVVMPFAVDLAPPQAGFAERRDITFLGGFNHPPNTDAALWLAEDIWPRIARHAPQARLVLAGASPPAEVSEAADGRILVPGRVGDLRPLFEGSRVFAAPLRYGAGVKGKILTAFAHGVPVVTTPVGAEGIRDGLALIAEDEAEFAAQILRLYRDEDLWRRMSARAVAYIAEEHSLAADVRVMREVLTLVAI